MGAGVHVSISKEPMMIDLLNIPKDIGNAKSFSFHDSINERGNVIHGRLKYSKDSLVRQWINSQTDSLDLKKYDLVEMSILLNQKKEEVIILEKEKSIHILLLVGSLLCLLGLIILQIWYKRYRLRTSQKIRESENLKGTIEGTKNTLNISKETVEILSHLLETFEKEQGFLDPNMTLNLLAKKMNTNSTYLSRVVNNTKGSNFSAYLNVLRITYIIEHLEEDSKLRHYTSKALGEEAGFKTRESFTKAFYKQVGVYPMAYLSKLENHHDL
ncbi:MAG: hypothetical protein COB60_00275 [Flavobacteriaceae bacterium]|nr:MAG: hypothetical protein COB60_00275 [Flavobacteriaceae bacterium]